MYPNEVELLSNQAPDRHITLKELEAHNGHTANKNKPKWTVIYGLVFDISAWQDLHPGGRSVIQLIAGRDATYFLECYHNTPSQTARAFSVIKQLKHGMQLIGRFKPTSLEAATTRLFDRSVLPSFGHSAFHSAVISRVHTFMRAHHLRYKGNSTWLETVATNADCLLTLALYITTGVLMWYTSSFPPLPYLYAALHALATVRIGLLMHCGHHRTFATAAINDLVGNCLPFAGANSQIWLLKHQVLHHLAPNIIQIDPDITGSDPFARFHSYSKYYRWMHKFQYIWVPIIGLPTVAIGWLWDDLRMILLPFYHNKGNLARERLRVDLLEYFVSVTWLLLLHVVLKWILVSEVNASSTAYTMLLYLLLTGSGLGGTFILNHVQNDLFVDTVDNELHWSVINVFNSANWASGSQFWCWMSGGLNHQIEHHLFPAMHFCNYHKISPIVNRTCAEYNIVYRELGGLLGAQGGLIDRLYKLGNGDRSISVLNSKKD